MRVNFRFGSSNTSSRTELKLTVLFSILIVLMFAVPLVIAFTR